MKPRDYGGIKGDSSKSLKSTVAAKWLVLSRVERCGTEEGGLIGFRLAAGWTKTRRATVRALLGSLSTTGLNGVGMKLSEECASLISLICFFFSSW